MEKYKTKANKAEEQILELLKDNRNIHRPWGLVKKQLINRTLDCASSEAKIIFENNCCVRPGFEVSDDKVYIPNLFIKFSGIDDNTSYFQKSNDLKLKSLVYENFNGFCDSETKDLDLTLFFRDDESFDKNFLLQSDRFQFSYLRREYQIQYIDKIELILNNKDKFFLPRSLESNNEQLLHFLLYIDADLINAFNTFDFHLKPPSLVFYNDRRAKMSSRQAASLLLMNLLGFDIIVLSSQGYADVENCFNEELYSLFYGEKLSKQNKMKKHTKILLASAVALVISATLLLGAVLPFPNNSEDPIENQIIEIPDTTEEIDTENTDIEIDTDKKFTNGISMTSQVYENDNFLNSQIDVYIYGPDGENIDMSQVSYTIYRGERILSYDAVSGRDPSIRKGPAFEVNSAVDMIQIVSKDDGSDIHYILSADTKDYAFLIEGQIIKSEYIANKRINLEFYLGGLDSTFLTVDTAMETVDSVGYYLYSSEDHDMPSEDFNIGCTGSIRTVQGKYFYTNLSMINLFTFYNTSDGIVFYQKMNQITASPSIGVRLDKRQCQKRTLSINPEINQFPIYVLDIVFPKTTITMNGYIPDNNIVNVYTNAFLPVTRISLSIDAFNLYFSSLAHIKFNGDKDFGYNVRIHEFWVKSSEGNWFNIQTRFTDENDNQFSYLGYSNDGAEPSEYDYLFEVSKDEKTLLSVILNPYGDNVELDLPNGSYDIIVRPAYTNSVYQLTSYFRMILDDTSEIGMNLIFLSNS